MKRNFENYSIEDDEKEQSSDNASRKGGDAGYTMWSIVPRMMIMPTSGWEMAKRGGPAPEIATLRFMLPISLLSGGAEFLSLLYPTQFTATSLLAVAIITFFSYFLGYYLALVFAKIFLPGEVKGFPSSNYGRLVTMGGVSTLAIFHILYKAFPMFDFIIEFFPIWTVFLIFKGMQTADVVPEKRGFSIGVMCMVVICCPVIIEWVLSLFA